MNWNPEWFVYGMVVGMLVLVACRWIGSVLFRKDKPDGDDGDGEG